MAIQKILVLGAGRSSTALIQYLLRHANTFNWNVMVADLSIDSALERISNHPRGRALHFNLEDETLTQKLIADADVVVSLLPASLHPKVATYCLHHRKHMITASYVSEAMKKLHADAVGQGLLFLNECGLDPGIDHMSAMQIIDHIKSKGGKIDSFESFTGGLIAPETDLENPWRYKFTWNPRNVVLAGQGTAKYLEQGRYKYIPYQQLFSRITTVDVEGHGKFEGYPNRDSLSYISTYGLDDIQTMIRGTLRYEGFCSAWNAFVLLGCCDDTYQMDGVEAMTHADYLDAFLPGDASRSLVERLVRYVHVDASVINKLSWSGFFSNEKVGLRNGTPAQILEHILNKKWRLNEADKDFVVMWHRFRYCLNGSSSTIVASLVCAGANATETAMANTVGLPLGIATRLLAMGDITSRGVVIPVTPEFYTPILNELKDLGIALVEREVD